MKTASKSHESIKIWLVKPMSLVLLLCLISNVSNAQMDTSAQAKKISQKDSIPAISIFNTKTDTAATSKKNKKTPPQRKTAKQKDTPKTRNKKGKVYVLDFWAT